MILMLSWVGLIALGCLVFGIQQYKSNKEYKKILDRLYR